MDLNHATASTTRSFEPNELTRLDVTAEMSAEARISLQSAEKILDELEDRILRSWLDGNAVVLPAIGPLDSLDRDADPDAAPNRTVTVDAYIDRIGAAAQLPAERVAKALEAACDLIDRRYTAGDVVWMPLLEIAGQPEAIKAFDRRNTREAIAQLADSTRPVWVLQCNPDNYDIATAIEACGLPDSWTISRHLDRIAVGDVVVLWMTGSSSGAYAAGFTTSTPYTDTIDEYGGDKAGTNANFVGIALHLNLWTRPVLRADLKNLSAFADEAIINAPFQANPHPMSRVAFDEILQRVRV